MGGINIKTRTMKRFELTIFKRHEAKHSRIVVIETKKELKEAKRIFWNESIYKKRNYSNWMGVKRISSK